MRTFTSSLSLLTFLLPLAAFAQEAVDDGDADTTTLDELPEEGADPAEEPDAAPQTRPPTTASGDLDAGASASVGLGAETTASPAPLAAPPAATAPVPAEPEVKRPAASRRFSEGGGGSWDFSYSGYFRAPMRIGISTNQGPQHTDASGFNADGSPANPDGNPVSHEWVNDPNGDGNGDDSGYVANGYLPKKTTFHLPVIPDNQYGSWQSTAHNRNDWAEMFFSVGNGTVSGTLAIQAFQFTDASWVADGAQFGIGQGWVEIDDDLGFENVNFNVKVGSHWARYGMAGLYDGGEYDTYLFGRTHTMGGTARLDLTLSAFDLAFEGGFGANQPDPEMYNRPRFTTAGHAHAFLTFPSVEFSANFLHAWANASASPSFPNVQPGSGGCLNATPGAQCTTHNGQNPPNPNLPAGTEPVDGTETFGGVDGPQGVWGNEYPTGTQTIIGADARADLGLLGYLYVGYSHQFLKNSLVVGNAIESIHSFGGGMYNLGITDNYLESPYCNRFESNPFAVPNDSCSNGTGTVGTLLGQYELGLGNFGIMPQGMDLKVQLYGMLNLVTVDDIEVERLENLYGFNLPGGIAHETLPAEGQAITMDDLRQDGTRKLKFGTDIEFFPLEFMSAGIRFDRLDPHSKLKNEGFSILSPRITFRSKMVTHEMITLQYSRYFYDQRACADQVGNVASPADDPFRQGSLYNQVSADTGYPLRLQCVQPPPSAVPPYGFGMHSNNQSAGNRGAATLIPDENVVKLEASMWW